MPVFADLSLETGRLGLRPVAPGDVDSLFVIFSDPEVMQYWSTPTWTRREQAERMVQEDVAEAEAGRSVRLAVLLRDLGRAAEADPGARTALVGTVSLFHLDAQSRRAEIGYALGRAAWGYGYAQEAVRAVIGYAFGVLDLNRLEADIDPRNEASGRVLERLGFRREGLLRQRWIVGGEVSDSAWYGLLREDWTASTRDRRSLIERP